MSSMRRILALAIVVTLAAAVAHGQNRPPAPGADPVIGSELFTNMCGFCNQNGGRDAGRGPKLAGTDRPDDYILNRIRTGKEGAMPAYGRAFSDVQMRSLIAYIRSLKDDGK
jgi:mono/diheme cytochrome c family protein